MEANDALVAAERARQDLEDIVSLKNSDAFNRYWMRRLTQKRAEVERQFKYEKVDKHRREELRQTMLALEELEKMMAVDEGNIKGGILRPTSARGGQPGQSGAPSASAAPLG